MKLLLTLLFSFILLCPTAMQAEQSRLQEGQLVLSSYCCCCGQGGCCGSLITPVSQGLQPGSFKASARPQTAVVFVLPEKAEIQALALGVQSFDLRSNFPPESPPRERFCIYLI